MADYRNVDWDEVKRLCAEWGKKIAEEAELRQGENGLRMKVLLPNPSDPQRCFGEIYCWYEHRDGKRAVSKDCFETRCEILSEQELIHTGEVIAQIITKADVPANFYRAQAKKVHNVRGGSPGFVWYRFCPVDMPEKKP